MKPRLCLDSSAIVKLIIEEQESGVLKEHLRRHECVASALTRTEVVCAVRGHGAAAVASAKRLLSTIALMRVSDAVLDAAGEVGSESLRSLDAIHLATALSLRDDIEAIVTYDRRMAGAARALGIPVSCPGQAEV